MEFFIGVDCRNCARYRIFICIKFLLVSVFPKDLQLTQLLCLLKHGFDLYNIITITLTSFHFNGEYFYEAVGEVVLVVIGVVGERGTLVKRDSVLITIL